MSEQTKANVKRWLISSTLTFLTGFGLVLLNDLDSITLESFQTGSVVGVLFTAIRAGLKGLLEAFLLWQNKR